MGAKRPGELGKAPNRIEEGFGMEVGVNLGKVNELHPDIRGIIYRTKNSVAGTGSVADTIETIVPGIFDGPGPDTSNVKYPYRNTDKMIQTGIPISKSTSMAHSITFIGIDLRKMKISNNPGIATIQSITSDDIFLRACNEAISGRLTGDDAYDYIKGRCELLTSQENS